MEGCRAKRQPDFYGGCCAGVAFKMKHKCERAPIIYMKQIKNIYIKFYIFP